jgi:hypothetical protein
MGMTEWIGRRQRNGSPAPSRRVGEEPCDIVKGVPEIGENDLTI